MQTKQYQLKIKSEQREVIKRSQVEQLLMYKLDT